MSSLKRAMLMAAIVFIGILCILIFWNQSLALKAEKTGDAEQRIQILERAAKYYPLNPVVFYELGKAYHDLGMRSLGEQSRSAVHIQTALAFFRRSLKVNPVSYFSHFYLAQALLNMSFYSPPFEQRAYQEFTKAAHLAGENIELLYEVGKVFLSRWTYLSREDRNFTVDILKKVVEGGDRARLRSLFYTWDLNGQNYEVMDKVFPEDPRIYREFADFLGQRDLSLEERQRYLAKAELLEFRQAQDMFEAGENDFFYFRFKDAQDHFKSCLSVLKKIRFYENIISPEEKIELSEYDGLKKRALLNLAKCLLEQGAAFDDAGNYLWGYLDEESSAEDLGEFESYIKEKSPDDIAPGTRPNDLNRLAFQLYLFLKEGRFRDIMRVGREFQRGIGIVPEGEEDLLAKIFEIIGESFQRSDFIYDANDFFYEALEWNPDALGVLVKLKKNYERLSAAKDVREIDRRIEEIISQREINLDCFLKRGQKFQRNMVFDGRKVNLRLHFSNEQEDRPLLITLLLDGKVVWEDYTKDDVVTVSVKTEIGDNLIQIIPVNRGTILNKITYE